MKRKDLSTGIHLAPGIYLMNGDEGDPEARVVGGPFDHSDDGKRTATILGQQLAARTGGAYSLVAIVDLPR